MLIVLPERNDVKDDPRLGEIHNVVIFPKAGVEEMKSVRRAALVVEDLDALHAYLLPKVAVTIVPIAKASISDLNGGHVCTGPAVRAVFFASQELEDIVETISEDDEDVPDNEEL